MKLSSEAIKVVRAMEITSNGNLQLSTFIPSAIFAEIDRAMRTFGHKYAGYGTFDTAGLGQRVIDALCASDKVADKQIPVYKVASNADTARLKELAKTIDCGPASWPMVPLMPPDFSGLAKKLLDPPAKIQCFGCERRFEPTAPEMSGEGSFSFGAKSEDECHYLCDDCATETKKFLLHLRGKSDWHNSDYD